MNSDLLKHFFDGTIYQDDIAEITIKGAIVSVFSKSPRVEVARRFVNDKQGIFYFRFLVGEPMTGILKKLRINSYYSTPRYLAYTMNHLGEIESFTTDVVVAKVYYCNLFSLRTAIWDTYADVFPVYRIKNTECFSMAELRRRNRCENKGINMWKLPKYHF